MFSLVKFIKPSTVRQHVRPLSQSSQLNGMFNRDSSKEAKPEEAAVDIIDNQEEELDIAERQRQINFIRNKSRLNRNHRNILHGTVPYDEGPESWVHETLKYKRKIYGQYGAASNIDPSK